MSRDDYIDEAGFVLTAGVYGLSGAEWLAELPLGKIRAAYNGIGPEWLPVQIREKLNKWLGLFAVCAVVHDCRFAYDNDGTDAKFRAANDELERNCLIMADSEYVWYNPIRYLWRHRAHVVAEACRQFGWDDWRKAFDAAKAQGIVSCAEKKQFPASAGNAGDERQTRSSG